MNFWHFSAHSIELAKWKKVDLVEIETEDHLEFLFQLLHRCSGARLNIGSTCQEL